MRWRGLSWLVFALAIGGCARPPFEGRVVDAANGRPIAGATVYAYWSEHIFNPLRFLIFDGHTNPPTERCGGVEVATTDSDGRYRLNLPVRVGPALHEAQLLVVAPRYYDPRGKRQWSGDRNALDPILATLQWNERSRDVDPSKLVMRSLDGVPIDARLLALSLAGPGGGCLRSTPDASERAFADARRRTLEDALCEQPTNPSDLPRTDLFRQTFARRDAFWNDAIEPFLTKQGELPIPVAALGNECARLALRDSNAGPDANVSFTFRGRLDVDGGQSSNANVPMRVFWGVQPQQRTSARGNTVDDSIPARGFVVTTDADGHFDFPVTAAMLDDPADDRSDPHYRWIAVPLTPDLISFDRRLARYPRLSIDGNRLAYEIDYLSSDARAFENRSVTSVPGRFGTGAMGGALGGAIGSGPMRSTASDHAPMPPTPLVQPDGRRALQELYPKTSRQLSAPNGTPYVMPAYRFVWSGPTLVWRTAGLLDVLPATENDPKTFETLVDAEIDGSFAALCARPDIALSSAEAMRAVKLLWWVDARSGGVDAASEVARQRASDWQLGAGCRTTNTGAALCSEWRHSRSAFESRDPALRGFAQFPEDAALPCVKR
jgi:hypothetical protein